MEHKQKKTSTPYSPEFSGNAVRLVMEHRDEYQSEAAALMAIPGKLSCRRTADPFWARQVRRDGGDRPCRALARQFRFADLRFI